MSDVAPPTKLEKMMNTTLSRTLNLTFPLIQAPMAGVSTPELAAAVSNAGGLGSLGVGASTPLQAEEMILRTQAMTRQAINVNVFCHTRGTRSMERERAWIARFEEIFNHFGTQPPAELAEIYQSFLNNEPMLDVLLRTRPAVVSFHFGLPSYAFLQRLRAQGIVTMASATSVEEARAIDAADIDFIIAQGIEAGGHRGIFNPDDEDAALSTFVLVQAIRQSITRPVVAAGGVMDGAGIAAMLKLGATGVQMGTAFVMCPESSASVAYREAIKSQSVAGTVMTTAISGRPARSLRNDFYRLTMSWPADVVPDYPMTYALGKSLAAAATAKGVHGFDAQWAGQGVALARELPAAELFATLMAEWKVAQ